MLSESIEHYLKAIYELQQFSGRVSTNSLAEKMNVTPASATGMMKKLSGPKWNFVNYEPHQGVALTEAGEKAALEVIRHHRLLETFLLEVLGYTWDEVHEEADKLEHYISEVFEDKINEYLNNPQFDPHGDPIPTKEGSMPEVNYIPLAELKPGDKGLVKRVRHYNAEFLRYIGAMGIVLDTLITVERKDPFDGPIYIKVGPDGPVHPLGLKITEDIFVKLIADSKEE